MQNNGNFESPAWNPNVQAPPGSPNPDPISDQMKHFQGTLTESYVAYQHSLNSTQSRSV